MFRIAIVIWKESLSTARFRSEAVAVSGGFGGHTETGLTAVALESTTEETDPWVAVSAEFGEEVKRVAKSGFEVVFVLVGELPGLDLVDGHAALATLR